MNELKKTILWLWTKYPALLYGLGCLLGFQCALSWNLSLSSIILFLWLPFIFKAFHPIRLRLLLSFLIACSSFAYAKMHFQFPELPTQGVEGIAHINISFLSESKARFTPTWIYQGNIVNFYPLNTDRTSKEARNIPYRIFLPQTIEDRPLANQDYYIRGVLKKTPSGYVLKLKKESLWNPIQDTWSLAEFRYQRKQQISKYLEREIKCPSASAFLTGMVTGDYEDRVLIAEFSRFGLQHILAVSGFHFVLLAAVLRPLLGLFLNRKITALFLITILTSYFLFLGCAPAVIRAWLTIIIFFIGHLLECPSTGINALGVSLLFSLLYDPLMSQNLGFQLSFLSTAAILFLYSGVDHSLQIIFIKRNLSKSASMSFLDQHGYLFLTYTRQAIALTLGVHIVALPVLLYDFEKFPTLSLVYNLFFPFLVTLSMLLLIIAFASCLFFPPLASLFHSINNFYTEWVLGLTYNLPISVDHYILFKNIPLYLVLIYLIGIFSWGAYLKKKLASHSS